MARARTIGAAVLAVLVVTGVLAGVATFRTPTVTGVGSEWGEVTEERTYIETTVGLRNPNPVGIPPVAGVAYEVRLNDVTVAENSRSGIGFGTGDVSLTLETPLDHSVIPAWWASHVNNGERTTVAIDPSASVLGVSRDLPAQRSNFSTDLIGAFRTDRSRTVGVAGVDLFAYEGTTASWGEATREATPLRVGVTLRNTHSEPIAFAGLGYEVAMNDVAVATADAGPVRIEPGETETVHLNATMDNSKLAAWWPTHVRNGERTVVDVDAYAAVETAGGTERVPLGPLTRDVRLETDILGGGGATTETVRSAGEGFSVAAPSLESVERAWMVLDNGTTAVRTAATVTNSNPEGSLANRLLAVNASYGARLNGVVVADGDRAVPLGPGRTTIELVEPVSGEAVQRWWVSHVNGGERTVQAVESRVVADVGFTSFGVRDASRRTVVTTDLLSAFESDDPQPVTVSGRRLGTIESTTASWGTATLDTTPMDLGVTLTNEADGDITVERVGYTVRLNDVTLANNATAVGETVAPGATERIAFRAHLDTDRADDWWVSHVRNGQESRLETEFYAVVEYRGATRRVPIEGIGSKTVRTNFFD